jgi:hypothetical protein
MSDIKLSETDKVLLEMLTENTGRHMLDSGGAYGRNWERNQGRDFLSERPTILTVDHWGTGDHWEMMVQHNVFHWLRHHLTYDPDMQRDFDEFAATQSDDAPWLNLMMNFPEEFLHKHYPDIFELGDWNTHNTYNGEDCLSRVIQRLSFGNGCHVLLQIHGGCDIRGGYTAPKAFTCEEYALMNNAQAFMSCNRQDVDERQLVIEGAPRNDDPHRWYTDDAGYHWYPDDFGMEELIKYPMTDNKKLRGKGHIYVNLDKQIPHCPICGSPLEAYF